MFEIIIHAPAGTGNTYEIFKPANIENNEKTVEKIITDLKLLLICKDERAGTIINADINIVPISLIPTTIVSEIRIDNTLL